MVALRDPPADALRAVGGTAPCCQGWCWPNPAGRGEADLTRAVLRGGALPRTLAPKVLENFLAASAISMHGIGSV
jgi:hypothetical protein